MVKKLSIFIVAGIGIIGIGLISTFIWNYIHDCKRTSQYTINVWHLDYIGTQILKDKYGLKVSSVREDTPYMGTVGEIITDTQSIQFTIEKLSNDSQLKNYYFSQQICVGPNNT